VPRRPRAVFPGIAHHITQRGNNRQAVFSTCDDRRRYLDLLGEYATDNGAHVLGYCLMTNHVHLVAVPEREDSLARTLGRVHSEYALAFNRSEQRSGHLWQNRFFSCPLDAAHLAEALRYADLNPVRAGLVALAWEWPWSSAQAHCDPGAMDAALHPQWTRHCGGWDHGEWRNVLAGGMPERAEAAVRNATAVGAPLGLPEFITQLEKQAKRRLRVFPRGRPRLRPMAGNEGEQGSLFAEG
jgi:putative transposase